MTAATPAALIGRLLDHAARTPEHPALVTPARVVSYAELAQLVLRQTAQFRAAGIHAAAVIGIDSSDDLTHLVLCLAGCCTGATTLSIPAHEPPGLQQALAERCGITQRVSDTDFAAAARHAPLPAADIPPEAARARFVFATSGTTGQPKLVVHEAADLVAQAPRHIETAEQRFACLAGLSHNFAKRHRLYGVASGATNVFPDTARVVEQCLGLRVSVLHLTAFQARELLALEGIEQLRGIRLKLGGSHVPVSLRDELRRRVTDNLQAGYGTTETGAIAFTDADDANAGDSVGRPLPGIEVRVELPARDSTTGAAHGNNDPYGELAIRCDGMFRGYLEQPELTAARLADGWFRTGDVGRVDAAGRIHVAGRVDDMFVFNSINIYPQELEACLSDHPDVADAVVVPRPSAIHGQIPVALVTPRPGSALDLQALQAHVRARAGVRSPREYIVTDRLARNAGGKLRRELVNRPVAHPANVRRTIAGALRLAEPPPVAATALAAFERDGTDIRLRDIELDSLTRMELLIALEVHYGVVLDPFEYGALQSLSELAAHVEAQAEALATAPRDADRAGDASRPVAPDATDPPGDADLPHAAKLFRRVFRLCSTVTQLHKALTTFGYRLTPVDVCTLTSLHHDGLLAPAAGSRFTAAIDGWLQRLQQGLRASGKPQPEGFVAERCGPALWHFHGPGDAANKTLLICFANHGGRSLMMPNAVLAQHASAAAHGLLIVAEPHNRGYRHGVPRLGSNVLEMASRLRELDVVRAYGRVRTLGSSAGCHAAIVTGHVLGAELAVSAAGRLYSWRYPRRNLAIVTAVRKAAQRGRGCRVLLCHDQHKTRDRNFSRLLQTLSGGQLLGVEFDAEAVGHYLLARLVERGELGAFLSRTLFASTGDNGGDLPPDGSVLGLPENRLRHIDT